MELLVTPFDLFFRQAGGAVEAVIPARTLDDEPVLLVKPYQPWVEVADTSLLDTLPRAVRVETLFAGSRAYYDTLHDWEKAVRMLQEVAGERYARTSLAKRFLMEHGLRLFTVWRVMDAERVPMRVRIPAYRAGRIVEDDPITFIPQGGIVQPVFRRTLRGVVSSQTTVSWEGWGSPVQGESDVLKRVEEAFITHDLILGVNWRVLLPRLAKRAEMLGVPFKPGVDYTPPARTRHGWGVRGRVLIDVREVRVMRGDTRRLLEDAYAALHTETALKRDLPMGVGPLFRLVERELPVLVKLAQLTRESLREIVRLTPGGLFIQYSGEQGVREGERIAQRVIYMPAAFAQPRARVRFPTLFADLALRWNAAADTLNCSCCRPADGRSVWHCEKRESRLLRWVRRVRDAYADLAVIVHADPRLRSSLKAAELRAYEILLEGVSEAYALPGSPFYAPGSVRFLRGLLSRLVKRVRERIVAFEEDTFYVRYAEDVPVLLREVERLAGRRLPYTLETFGKALLLRGRKLRFAYEHEGRFRMEGFASRLSGLSGAASLLRDRMVKRLVEGASRRDILGLLEDAAAWLPRLGWEQLVMSLDTALLPRRVWRDSVVREALRKSREGLLFYVKLQDGVLLLDELARLGEGERDMLRARLDVEYYAETQFLRVVQPFLSVLDIPLEEAEEAFMRGIMQSGYYLTPMEE